MAVVIYGLVFRLRTSYLSVWSSFSFDSIKGGEINYLQKELLHPHKIYCFAWIGWTDTKRNRMVGGGWAITGAIPGASEDSDGTDDDTEEAQKVDAIGTLKNNKNFGRNQNVGQCVHLQPCDYIVQIKTTTRILTSVFSFSTCLRALHFCTLTAVFLLSHTGSYPVPWHTTGVDQFGRAWPILIMNIII